MNKSTFIIYFGTVIHCDCQYFCGGYKKLNSICFFVGKLTFKSGIVRVVYNIANEFRKKKEFKISFMCTFIDKEFQKEFRQCFQIYDLNLEECPKKLRYLRMVKGVRKYIKENKFDIIIISGMEFVLPCWMACLNIREVKKIAWEHRNFFAGPRFRMEYLGKRLACKKFDAIINITKKDYQFYQKYKGNTIGLYQIYNLIYYNKNYREYDFKSHKIISCGTLSKIKGFDMLIEIAAKIMPLHKEWTWDIYGDGDERFNLEKLISKYNLKNQVFLRGYHTNLSELYSQYSFFVFTSRMEGMGSVLVEAQRAGLPIVSFDILCGPSEIVVDDKNGCLIRPFDTKEMAEKINVLIESEEMRKELSSYSKIKHNEFERKFIIEKWQKMLRDF